MITDVQTRRPSAPGPQSGTSDDARLTSLGRVLVVDDEPRNREVVEAVLTAEGYTVIEVGNGPDALAEIASDPVDVVVLDLVMPGMDGLEVCRRLKADPATATIPVLFVTAHDARQERLNCIEAGASDFLRKPVDLTDLRLRVRNAVASKKLYDGLQAEYARVVTLERYRDDLVHMMAHDIKSPLTAVQGNLELLSLSEEGELSEDASICVAQALQATAVVVRMVHSMLELSRLESKALPVHLEPCDILDVIAEGMTRVAFEPGRVVLPTASQQPQCFADRSLLVRVLVNIVDNALGFSPPEVPVRIEITEEGDFIRVSVTDKGPGLDPAHHERVFERFGQAPTSAPRRKGSVGLGLAFCKLAMEAQGGRVGVDSVPGSGATFWFEAPRA